MMKTEHLKITDIHIDEEKIKKAAALLAKGELVAFPTETVYGLGADAANEVAVSGIFAAKGRPQDNPLIVHVASVEHCRELVQEIPDYAEKLMDRFSPGPITYVLPHRGGLADNVTAGLATVGIRIPDHPLALALIRESGCPIAAPSANTSGKPSPTTAFHVAEDLDGKIACIVDGGATGIGVESTVIDCTGKLPVVLRPGGITQEMIEEAIGEKLASTNGIPESDKPKAPGMKYRHYAPVLPLILVQGDASKIKEFVRKVESEGKRVAVLASKSTADHLDLPHVKVLGTEPNEIAANLYAALRHYTEKDADLLICEAFSRSGIGEAIMNRLAKAAEKHMIL
ncbi:L-threonylcarbamoyladenylate synthase [Aciduricibacillus chroicocephali]|uniref:Threonylcarbamoyl-AMP synthase n=1 Tax=Aciduricibacillus chroicocephali TaxID=3054939 RepID=A0ABY9KTW6_9BACI|nr:L-threonylcarbamoyladenylate synthase [Bacillaceae bacterium 44XB]